MSRTDRSRSDSDPEPAARPAAAHPFHRDAWRELNLAQILCIAGASVSGLFGLFGGVILALSVAIGVDGGLPRSLVEATLIPSCVALTLALGAVVFTRTSDTRRAARQMCGPAVLMGLTGLLATVIGRWLAS